MQRATSGDVSSESLELLLCSRKVSSLPGLWDLCCVTLTRPAVVSVVPGSERSPFQARLIPISMMDDCRGDLLSLSQKKKSLDAPHSNLTLAH